MIKFNFSFSCAAKKTKQKKPPASRDIPCASHHRRVLWNSLRSKSHRPKVAAVCDAQARDEGAKGIAFGSIGLYDRAHWRPRKSRSSRRYFFVSVNSLAWAKPVLFLCLAFSASLLAAHRAVYLAGESPAAVIGCLPHSYNRRLIGVTHQAKARS